VQISEQGIAVNVRDVFFVLNNLLIGMKNSLQQRYGMKNSSGADGIGKYVLTSFFSDDIKYNITT